MEEDIKQLSKIRSYLLKLVWILIILGCGSGYAVYVLKNNTLTGAVINGYLSGNMPLPSMKCFAIYIWHYLKKILIVWAPVVVEPFWMLSILIAGLYIFSYGFSVTLLLAACSDSFVYLAVLAGQGMFLISYLVQMAEKLIRKEKKQYGRCFWKGVLISVILAGMEMSLVWWHL